MAETDIEWADFTFNPWAGCTKISPGCDHCYAEAWARRSGLVEWGDHPRHRTSEYYWKEPLKWNRRAGGTRPRVFCASLADVFDNQVHPVWRADLFSLIDRTPNLDWLLLTKRPQNIASLITGSWPKPNVWLGVTAENQEEADRRLPILKSIPAVVRFVSAEPLLGPIRSGFEGIDWVIVGGESGPGARATHLYDIDVTSQAVQTARVPLFVKQLGSRPRSINQFGEAVPINLKDKKGGNPNEWPADLRVREFPTRHTDPGSKTVP